jgi:tetratricopeptide (TPR) repeat protein
VVWLDEYGPRLVHPHSLLDLASDRPRRLFSSSLLQMAWDDGVPGLLDLTESFDGAGRDGDGVKSTCVVSLGSDGPRSWFLVVDSLTPRPALNRQVTEELMFLSGEMASIVFHRDFSPRGEDLRGGKKASSRSEAVTPGFAGWPVLQDIEGRPRDGNTSQRITNRFLVARAVWGVLEEKLVVDLESLRYQVSGIRAELGPTVGVDSEREVMDRVLGALYATDHEALVAALPEWGKVVEGLGHMNGALEIQRLAYDLAVLIGASDAAADAARFQGKAHRIRAEWDEAETWYGVARRVAEEEGNHRKVAVILDGLANTVRDRGNLPRARELLQEVMALGRRWDDRYAVAIAHHDLMTVERLCGRMAEAIRHGWVAVESYDSRDGSLKALFDLAGVLRDTGELSAARDAYTVVADQLDGVEYRILALDALAFIAALQGERDRYRLLRARLDAEGWEELSPMYRGQILFYRGLSSRALGREKEGEGQLREALRFAEEHSLNWLIFDIEKAVGEDRALSPPPATASHLPGDFDQEIAGVRQGLRKLRAALVDSG